MQTLIVGNWVIYDSEYFELRFTGVIHTVLESEIVIHADCGVFYSVKYDDLKNVHTIDKSGFNNAEISAEDYRFDALLEYVNQPN